MIRAVIFILVFFPVSDVLAQCSVNRYLTSAFSSERIAEDVIYQGAWALSGLCLSENTTSYNDYDLDVYAPVSDAIAARPCIVFAHGGSFLFGNKQTDPVPDFCYEMAARGFVVVSINYRKCFNPLSTNSAMRAVYRAVQDMKSAIRFVKANAAVYGVDTSLVFAGGNSAGAIMALHAAYLDEHEREQDLPATYLNGDLGCLNCIGLHQNMGSKPRGVINLWGGIGDTSWIAAPNDFPVVSFHGTADDVVFYDTNNPFNYPLFPEISGSGPVHAWLEEKGIVNRLFTLEDEPHEAWNDAALFDFIAQESAQFIYDYFLKPDEPLLVADSVVCSGTTVLVHFAGGPDEEVTHCLDISGGNITGYGQGFVEVEFPESGEFTMSLFNRNQWGALSDTVFATVHVVDPPEPFSIEVASDTLIAPEGYVYSWYLNGVWIEDAENHFIVATWPGTYEVIISDQYGCTSISAAYEWIYTGIPESTSEIEMFPNPARDRIFISGSGHGLVQLMVLDMQGKIVLQSQIRLPGELNVETLIPGVYVVWLQTDNELFRKKLMIVK